MDDERVERYGGFSLAKIMLSDVLPASLYYPGSDWDPERNKPKPIPYKLRRKPKKDS